NTERRFFRKRQPRTHHVHIAALDSAELRDHLAFRDALRANPAWCDQYAALKHELAEHHRNNRAQYSASKTEFVQKILSSAK
ncbi:MAG TPA: GrpB family protein, partial [Anaerolineae bacterium]|nr:GrpB family protein [Anaerolineae bacterium]